MFFCFYGHAEDLGTAPLDPDYESRFYSIYREHHSRQMPVNEWLKLINQKEVNVYTIQKGDNLWDISRMLFGESNYWPKLWSVNADLSNPHRVSVGHELRVVMGSEGQVPTAVINGQSSAGSPPVEGGDPAQRDSSPSSDSGEYSVKESSCVTDLGLILNRKGSTSVYDSRVKCRVVKNKLQKRKKTDRNRLKDYFAKQREEGEEAVLQPLVFQNRGVIPKSLPPIKLVPEKGVDLVGLGKHSLMPHKHTVVSYQVDRNDVDIIGNIFSMMDGISVPTAEIVVELDVPANSGDIFSIVGPLKKVQPRSLFISGPFGYEVVFQAQARVVAPIPGREGLYVLRVMNMYSDVNEDSKIIRETPSIFDFQPNVRSGQTRAQITAIPHDQSSLALTIHSFIYVNRGRNDNVRVGDVFNITSNPRFHDTPFGKTLGQVEIVHTSGDFSTGFVKHLTGVAYTGDYLDPLDSVSYKPDAEEDDIYEEDDDRYEEDEEEEFAVENEEDELSSQEFDEPEEPAGEEDSQGFDEPEEPAGEEDSQGFDEPEEPAGEEDSQGFDELEEPAGEEDSQGFNELEEPAGEEDSQGFNELEEPVDEEDSQPDEPEGPVGGERDLPADSMAEDSFFDEFEDEEREWDEE